MKVPSRQGSMLTKIHLIFVPNDIVPQIFFLIFDSMILVPSKIVMIFGQLISVGKYQVDIDILQKYQLI